MVHSTHHPDTETRSDITVTAGIDILKRADIPPWQNMGFSMRRGQDVFFPDDQKKERTASLKVLQHSGTEEIPLWRRLHGYIYQRRTDVNVLITSRLPYTLTAAHAGRDVPPLLDDFAQLVGVTARVVREDKAGPLFAYQILKGLKHRNAVLVPEWGGLCGAASFDDALAVVQVLEKGCRAHIDSAFLGGGFRINPVEAWLMRMVYKYKYSKMKASGIAQK